MSTPDLTTSGDARVLDRRLDGVRQRALLVGGAGLLVGLVGAFVSFEQFLQSYLLAYLFVISVALGSFGFVMLHNMVGGAWGFVIRRFLETGVQTLPLMALLFLPIAFGLDDLYLWARPEAVAADELLQHKEPYLNAGFFLGRTALYFAVWIGLGLLVVRWSMRQDETADPALTRRMQLMSGPGLVLYGLTASFAAVDWGMTLEPHWFSTIYGMLFVAGQGLTTLAFAILVLAFARRFPPLSHVTSKTHLHDLGNLTLAFVMLWAYLAFSQYLIIWSGNLPEEIPWYLHRTAGGWQVVALLLVAFHFVLPFFLLLARRTKKSVRMLSILAVGILLMRFVDFVWLIVPAFHPEGFAIHWLDVALTVGLGGVWLAAFAWLLRGKALLPYHDPRLGEALEPVRGI